MRMIASYRRFIRFRQIINIMVRNGFDGFIESLRLRRLYRKKPPPEAFMSPTAKRLRLTLEELGPTFIKMGQMLSTRADLVPQDIFIELQKLQDQVLPVKSDEIKAEIESELKMPVNDIFDEFDDKPLASASIGQVHKARLKTGESVAVKIQRPNIKKVVEDDLNILNTAAILAERHVQESKIYNPVGFVHEFAKAIRNELDYTLEARNMERFAHNFANDKGVHIPKVYWNFCTSRIITMEFVDGVKVSHINELQKLGYDTKRIARKGAEAYLKQIFTHRFFHGDPHPGNIYILPGEVIAFMDFGIIGRLTMPMTLKLNNLLIAIARKDPEAIADAIIAISTIGEDTIMDNLMADIAEFMDKYEDTSLGQLQVEMLVHDMAEISSRYRLVIDRQLNLLARVLAQVEGLGRQLDPDFNITPLIQPFAESLIARRNSPKEILKRTYRLAGDYTDLIKSLPRDIQATLDKAKNGKLRIEFKHVALEGLVSGLERSTSRLAFAIIIAALVVSSSMIMALEKPLGPSMFGIPIIGALGYVIAAISGLWLIITIIRNRTLS
jgi:ubiquinone biosynthesis protein